MLHWKEVPCLEILQIPGYCVTVNYRNHTWLLLPTKRIIPPITATWASEGLFSTGGEGNCEFFQGLVKKLPAGVKTGEILLFPLICIVSNLGKIRKCRCCPPWKYFCGRLCSLWTWPLEIPVWPLVVHRNTLIVTALNDGAWLQWFQFRFYLRLRMTWNYGGCVSRCQ